MALPVRMPTPKEKGKGMYILYVLAFGLLLFLVSLIPPIRIPLFEFEWYILPPKIVFNIRFWFYVFLWILVQVGIFYIYAIVFKFVKHKALPYIKRIEDIPSKIQFYLYKR